MTFKLRNLLNKLKIICFIFLCKFLLSLIRLISWIIILLLILIVLEFNFIKIRIFLIISLIKILLISLLFTINILVFKWIQIIFLAFINRNGIWVFFLKFIIWRLRIKLMIFIISIGFKMIFCIWKLLFFLCLLVIKTFLYNAALFHIIHRLRSYKRVFIIILNLIKLMICKILLLICFNLIIIS